MPNAIKIGSEILVNTTTLSAQEAPAIMGLSGGGFVVTWTDYSQTGGDTSIGTVRAQIFHADGSKAGNELLLPTTTTGTQSLAVIAALTQDRFVVAWEDGSRGPGDASGTAVRAQILKADGTPVGAEFLIPTTTLNHQAKPALATLADGRFVAAWSDMSGNGDIRAKIFDLDGTDAVGEFVINTTTQNSQDEPTVAALGDGRFVVAWTDFSATGGDLSAAAIRAQMFDADGVRVGSEFVVNTTTAGSQIRPAITALTDGRFVATWTDFSFSGADHDGAAVRMQVFNPDGTRSGSEVLLNTNTAGNQQQPALTALPEGRFIAAWTDGSGTTLTQSEVRAQLFDSDGSRMGPELTVNTTTDFTQWKPAITALSDGRIAVAWEDQSATGGDASSNAIRAQIFDLREPPVITSGNGETATIGVVENSIGVAAVTATDADSPTLTYSIAGGADAARFQLDATTGALSFVAAPNYEAPADTGANNSYQVMVRASDGVQHDEQTITVLVENVNEAPDITSNGGGSSASFVVAENGTAVTTVTASDPDPGHTVAYSIFGGADAALFWIDPTTGVLSFNQAPDYEALGANHAPFKVVVRASDGALSTDQLLQLRVYDMNEAPQIAGGDEIATVGTAENTTAVTTVAASDPESDSITYSIAGGADAALFAIDATTGVLSFVTAPDFEAPADADQNNVYQVEVRASDGVLSGTQGIAVHIGNIAESTAPPPRAGSEFLLNTTSLESQMYPSIAGFADGRFVAAWTDHSASSDDPSGSAVRAQVFGADGTRLGNELLVNTTTAGDQSAPDVTALQDGRFVVTWADDSLGTDVPVIRAQIFNFDGSKAGVEFTINAALDVYSNYPTIAGLPGGGFVAAWLRDNRDGEDDPDAVVSIHAQLFTADGVKSGGELQASTGPNAADWDPAITTFPDGRFAIGWAESAGEQSGAIHAQVFAADGAPTGNPLLVSTVADAPQAPVFATLADGRLVATWTDASPDWGTGTEIYACMLGADGTTFGPQFRVNSTTHSDQWGGVVAPLPDGRFVIAWTDSSATGNDPTEWAVRAQVFDADGFPFGTELVVNTTTDDGQSEPTISALADGRFVVAWHDNSGTGGDTSGLAVRGQIFDTRDAAIDVTGTTQGDDFIGTGFGDVMSGNAGNDHLRGAGGNDTLAGNDGDDVLDGGAGFDTAVYSGPASAYTITEVAGGFQISGPQDGTDTLVDIERAFFTDSTVLLSQGTPLGHPPVITSDGGGDAATVSLIENSFVATTVTASDPDNDGISYAIAGGIDAALFHVDIETGTLAFIDAPDFEAPADADHDNSYEVTVRASDGNWTDTQTLNVNVTDVNETPEQQMVWLIGTPGNDTFAALPGNERIDGLGASDTVSFNFKLTDASVTYAGNQVIIDSATSHTVLTGFEVFAFTDGTVHTNDGDPLVDDLFYYAHNHDVWDAHVDADAHYHAFGWHEGRDPNAFFSTALNQSLYQDTQGQDPLRHFDQLGWLQGRLPSAAFDAAAYLAANPDVAAAHVDPLFHFLLVGAEEGRQPFAAEGLFAANGFDSLYYLAHNPDVAAAHVDPLWHFQTVGWHEGRNPNAHFDIAGYLNAYADVAAAGINPFDHYNLSGWHEGRDPSVGFDTTAYLAANPDVAQAQVNPLTHYLVNGAHEGRSPMADGVWG